MRWILIIAFLCTVTGAGLFWYAQTMPVYTDRAALEKLSSELWDRDERDRFALWYAGMQKLETPHKRLSDLGRGLAALGGGLLLAGVLWARYHWLVPERRPLFIGAWWAGLWLLRLPFIPYYYNLRAKRGDYPSWGDTTIIPIAGEGLTVVLSLGVTGLLLKQFYAYRPLPDKIRWRQPETVLGWIRDGFLVLWMLSLALIIYESVRDGDEGLVICCVGALPLMLAVLCARVEKMADVAGPPLPYSLEDGDPTPHEPIQPQAGT